MNRSFVTGFVVGCLGVWGYHKWIKPLPTSATK